MGDNFKLPVFIEKNIFFLDFIFNILSAPCSACGNGWLAVAS